jgi:hypothetical protein
MTRTEELLATLTPEVRAKVQVACEDPSPAATAAVTEAVGLPSRSGKGGVTDVMPLPAELSPAQRAVAEIIAREDLLCYSAAIPQEPEGILRCSGSHRRRRPSAR